MKRLTKTLHALKGFVRSESGSAMPLIGFSVFALLGATGISIDMGRVQMAQSRMTNALDAAGLAAGANANSVNINDEVTKYFYANFPQGYMGTQVQSLTVTAEDNNKKLTLNSSGLVDTTFMKVFGINSVEIEAQSEITRSNMGMELVLVMDTTGAMAEAAGGGQSKIVAAKAAANTLLNILYGSQNTQENLWVGLVPFSHSVNIGTSHSVWTKPDTFNWGPSPSAWMGCVDAREVNGQDTTDTPPLLDGSGVDNRFPKSYWPCDVNYNAWYGTNNNRNNCETTPANQVKYKSPLNTSLGPNKQCSQAVTPLTSLKSTVVNAVSTLTPNGDTHIGIGAVWAWHMLSPTWRGLWGGEMNSSNLPFDYNTPLMNKVVVIMTDGDNTLSNSAHGAYWYLSDNKLGTTNATVAKTKLNERLATVCSNMKANNIMIYTVAFGTNISTTVKNLLKSCATKPEYYFYSPTGADLQASFQQIGDSLANLRISK